MRKKMTVKDFVAKYPGVNCIALKGKGWRPNIHGSLWDAEKAGEIEYRNGGWYLVAQQAVEEIGK